VRRMHSRSCVNEGVGGKPVQITGAPAVRKRARGPSMLHMLLSFPVVSLSVECTNFQNKPKSVCSWASFRFSIKSFRPFVFVTGVEFISLPPSGPEPAVGGSIPKTSHNSKVIFSRIGPRDWLL